jgi:EAL and modified HD-GYP domain-containing signal transduction protein
VSTVSRSGTVAFAREPIHDAAGALAGYELLGLTAIAGTCGPLADADASRVALSALSDIGLPGTTGGAPAFLNVGASLLAALDPLPFGPEGIVLELQPPAVPDADFEERAARLRERGYTLALDRFASGRDLGTLAGVVHIVKLSAGAVSPELVREAAALAPGARLAAFGVDDHATLERCLALGVALVQGAVHVRPRPLAGRAIPVGDLEPLRAAVGLGGDALDVDELARAITMDVGLSVRLLRYLNSAAFSLRSHISSVRQAVVLLGPRTVRQWALLVTLAERGAVRGPLLVRALARARLAEAIARRLNAPDPDAYFTAGLFSVLDALLDAPLPDLLAELPLADDLVAALVEGTGGKGRVLAVVRRAEAGDWAGAQALLPALPTDALAALHTAALRWADLSTRELVAAA